MSGSTYDRLFHMESGYNNKLHRDDREHAKSRGLKVHDEVSKNTVVAVVDPKPGNLVKFLPPQFFKGPHWLTSISKLMAIFLFTTFFN